METQNRRIGLYKVRNLSGRLMAAFQFISDNFSVLLRLSSWIVVPVSAVTALFLVFFGDAGIRFSYKEEFTTEMAVYLLLLVLVMFLSLVASCALGGLIYLLMDKYQKREKIVALTPGELRRSLTKITLHLFSLQLVIVVLGIVAVVVAGGFSALSFYTVFIVVPLLYIAFLPLLLAPVVYYFERKGIVASLARSYRIGMPAWGSTFLVWFAVAALSFLVSLVAGAPWLVANSVKVLYTDTLLSGEPAALPFYFYLLYFLVAFSLVYVAWLMHGVMSTAMVFQYGSIVAKREEQEEFDKELAD